MADKKDKGPEVKFITPKGVAIYPKLNKPDFKFKPEGEFGVKLRLAPDAIPAATIAKLQETLDKFAEETKATLKPADQKKFKQLPLDEQGLKPELDDDGNETGSIILKAGMKHSGKSKKDGKEWKRWPTIFDAKGKKLQGADGKGTATQIWGGSELKVAVIGKPYYSAKDKVCGITFYMDAVQVIKLVNGTDKDAKSYGFGEEEGFEGEEPETFPAESDEAGADGDAKSGDDF